jgi:hypothetical protein
MDSNEYSKWGLPFLYILYLTSNCEKKQKITTFVRFSDYHLNIPRWDQSFLILLHWDSYALIYLPLAHPSDI